MEEIFFGSFLFFNVYFVVFFGKYLPLHLAIFYLDCSPCVTSPPRTPLGVLNGILSTPNSRTTPASSARATPTGPSGNTPKTPAEERVLKKVGRPFCSRYPLIDMYWLKQEGLKLTVFRIRVILILFYNFLSSDALI